MKKAYVEKMVANVKYKAKIFWWTCNIWSEKNVSLFDFNDSPLYVLSCWRGKLDALLMSETVIQRLAD